MQIIALLSIAYAGVIQSAESNSVVKRADDDITENLEVSFDKRDDEEPIRKVKGIPGNFAY